MKGKNLCILFIILLGSIGIGARRLEIHDKDSTILGENSSAEEMLDMRIPPGGLSEPKYVEITEEEGKGIPIYGR